jgi:hypothetical protein
MYYVRVPYALTVLVSSKIHILAGQVAAHVVYFIFMSVPFLRAQPAVLSVDAMVLILECYLQHMQQVEQVYLAAHLQLCHNRNVLRRNVVKNNRNRDAI